MPAQPKDIVSHLDELFKRLDNAKLAPATMLK
jgi:hypothetical protein